MQQEKYTTEELSGDDRKIASMLGALKRVEAPADFDLRLKGRIARGVPSSGSMIAPWLRYAALPVLLLGLAGFLAFNGMFTLDSGGVPEVTESRFQPDESPIPAPTVAQQVEIASKAESDDVILPVAVNAISRSTAPTRKDRVIPPLQSSGGSVDRTQTETNTRILPRGFTIDPPVVNQRPGEFQDGGISVKDALEAVGVAAAKLVDGWKVRSVRSGTVAEKSGVKASDIIEAIGNHSVKDKESLSGKLTVDSITLVRSGKRLVIKLTGR